MKIESSEHLFQVLSAKREKLEYSQRKTNKLAGVASSTWNLIEKREDNNMNIKTALAYADALRLQIEVVEKK
jgi:DNA-binding XRE family transcriptional regulator